MAFTFPSIDFDEFHRGLSHLVPIGGDIDPTLGPLAFVLPGDRAVTHRIVDGCVDWESGCAADATTVIEIDAASFGAFALEYLTAPALMIQGRITITTGDFGQFDRWEPLLRLLYVGRPPYDPSAIDRTDLDRDFVWDVDDIDKISDFYRRNGFAVIRDVFTAEEIAALDAELDRLASDATVEDDSSWWTTTPDGEERVCQLHYTSLASPTIDHLEHDVRIAELVAAVDPSFVAHPSIGNGHFAVLKNPGASGGLTDLAWHVDCGLGGHPILCPSLHIGVQVREMTAASGPMMFLAGSHRTSPVRPSAEDADRWPIVTVSARPGDVTLHSPDAVHAAPPPTGASEGRRTIYLSFGRPDMAEVFGFKEGYDHLVLPNDGRITTDSE